MSVRQDGVNVACRDGWFSVSRQYSTPPVAILQNFESIEFANILYVLDHSSEFNRWIWPRFVQERVKILKNVLPEAQPLENSVAKVMHASRSGS